MDISSSDMLKWQTHFTTWYSSSLRVQWNMPATEKRGGQGLCLIGRTINNRSTPEAKKYIDIWVMLELLFTYISVAVPYCGPFTRPALFVDASKVPVPLRWSLYSALCHISHYLKQTLSYSPESSSVIVRHVRNAMLKPMHNTTEKSTTAQWNYEA